MFLVGDDTSIVSLTSRSMTVSWKEMLHENGKIWGTKEVLELPADQTVRGSSVTRAKIGMLEEFDNGTETDLCTKVFLVNHLMP